MRHPAMLLVVLVPGPAPAVPPVPADLGDYAFGACLIAQRQSGYLRDQGYLLGQMQINRFDAGEFLRWRPIGAAVEAELGAEPALEVRTDGPVSNPTAPAPVAQCLQVVRSARVRAAIAAVRARWARRR